MDEREKAWPSRIVEEPRPTLTREQKERLQASRKLNYSQHIGTVRPRITPAEAAALVRAKARAGQTAQPPMWEKYVGEGTGATAAGNDSEAPSGGKGGEKQADAGAASDPEGHAQADGATAAADAAAAE